MPFLDDLQVRQLLVEGRDQSNNFMPCCSGARDYCRSCDEFYWLHNLGCPRYEAKHHGHRLTIVPFVQEQQLPAGQQYVVCPKCGQVSYSPSDILERYCGACHGFHDDLMQQRR